MWNLGWMYENGVGVPQVCNSHLNFQKPRLREAICRTFILLNDIMTWHSRLIQRRTCLSYFPWSNYTYEAYGTLSEAVKMGLTCGISRKKQVSSLFHFQVAHSYPSH